MMKRLKVLVIAAVTALGILPAAAKDYRLLSSWDDKYAYNPFILYPFMDGVKAATNGRVTITFNGPESVPPFEQLEPVSKGVFQFLFTHGAYHFGTTPIMTAADALEGDLTKIRASGVMDLLDKHYQKYNLKLVSLPITPEGAYHIFLRRPVSEKGGLEGRKIRGSLTYKGIVEMLGGVLTVLPPAEIYTSLEKGVIDGAAWPIIGMLDYKWNEVAPFIMRPGFGVNYEPIFMNLDAWKALSPEDQQAILKVGAHVEDIWFRDAASVWKKEEEALLAKGVKITEMGPEQKAKLRDAWGAGLWALSASKNAAATKELQDFAKSKGIAR
jgi:TRAP-type C4-dicarboxylate transport system substrate-binding protein